MTPSSAQAACALLLSLGASLSLPSAFATSVTSEVMGGNMISIAAGNVPVAPAYVHPATFEGVVHQFVANGSQWTLNFTGVDFVPNAFNPSGGKAHYYVEVTAPGDFLGAYFDILSNTATGVTVDGIDGDSLPGGTSVLIRKHMTVREFFSNAEGSMQAFVDAVKLFYPFQQNITLFWIGSGWSRDFGGTNDDDYPIYPGQGFLAGFGAPVNFATTGCVKSTPTQVPVFSGDINFVGSGSPVPVSYGELNAASQMGLYTDAFQTFSVSGNLAVTATYFNVGGYVSSDFFSNHDNLLVPANAAILIGPASNFNWVLPSPLAE